MRFKKGLIMMFVLTMLALPVLSSAEWIGVYHFKHIDSQGNVIAEWEDSNSLADEGEQLFLDVLLRGATAPTTFYLGLTDSTSTCSIADTDTLATVSALGEPSTNGYARQNIERSAVGWPTLALDSGDYQATSKTVTFTATGGSWGPVYCAFLGTTLDNTGKLVSYAALSTGRTLAAGESLQITYKVKLQ